MPRALPVAKRPRQEVGVLMDDEPPAAQLGASEGQASCSWGHVERTMCEHVLAGLVHVEGRKGGLRHACACLRVLVSGRASQPTRGSAVHA